MQYLKPKFTLPAAPSKVTQEEWDRIFGEPEPWIPLVKDGVYLGEIEPEYARALFKEGSD